MGILVVVGAAGGQDMVSACLGHALGNARLHGSTKAILIDNASDPPLVAPEGVSVLIHTRNEGNYPIFRDALDLAQAGGYPQMAAFTSPIVAVFHSDLWVYEDGWDAHVEEAFAAQPRLGLLGFVGSDELDENGGRGGGTVLNFQGRHGGGPAEAHGRRITGLVPAAQVDGCAMVFCTEAMAQIGFREGFPPHHFYDRLMSCQMLEAGWRVGVLGVACDHLGGRTAGTQAWQDTARDWCLAHGVPGQPGLPGNWDYAVYREAERQFLSEYRDQKRFIPRREIW